ncbi:hypothetical protein O181_060916 [Austropuccinia psidii MF-1]|uniref:Uncharacterized protein n=1 Tax=Austropuccinia psidii MF-1 TaxID=1389203 RepID=A0A9Q3HX14_9BASI|nr:hypothetical protein [Austropuccinia psidii MF-1]
MDSLHPSLSQALPLRDYDAEQALQAPFRAAALGIATFYKRAAENGRKAYSLGYSSALQDVLEFLQAGLDYQTDQNEHQHSEQRMALTIERVMDYIQRRQEALRAESQEPSEEDGINTNSSSTQQTAQNSSSINLHQSISSSSQTNSNQSQSIHSLDNNPSNPSQANSNSSNNTVNPSTTLSTTSSSLTTTNVSSNSTNSTLISTSRRRTSPRQTNSPSLDHIQLPTCRSSDLGPNPPSTFTPSSSTLNFSFSSLNPTLLSHHQHHSIGSNNSSRRHRNVMSSEPRKGKAKDRSNALDRERSISASQLDSFGLVSSGYSHYSPTLPSSSTDSANSRVLSSIGNKRRYPIESTLISSHEPSSVMSASLTGARAIRRANLNSRIVPTTAVMMEGTEETHRHSPISEGPIKIHSEDDVVMFLQPSPQQQPYSEESIERASKRISTRKNKDFK